MGIVPAGYTAALGEDTQAGVIDAGPDFFDVLGIRVIGGRVFDRDDIRSHANVVVVNERFVRKYFGREQPIGRVVNIPTPAGPSPAAIIGVVADVRHYGVKSDPWPMVYRPAPGSASSSLIVRMRDRASGAAVLRSAIDATGTLAQVETVTPLEDAVTGMISEERMLGLLSAAIASIALGLAALGLYGIVAYGASCRRAEFGIRLALGARRWEIQRLVLRQTTMAIAIGVTTGIAGAVAAARVMKRFLDESAALDWQMVVGAAVMLVAIALFAAWLPAWRAARVDPATILRAE
jgi:ABC-type antimicrobial peptide transport system permease subunit